MSNPPPFSFGQTSTSGNTGNTSNTSNPFAQNPSSNATVQGGLFGTNTAAPASTNTYPLGKLPTASVVSPFNQQAGQAPSTVGGASSLAGSVAKPNSTGFNFGPSSQAGGTTFTDISSFSTPNKTSQPLTTAPSQLIKPIGGATAFGSGSYLGSQNLSGAAGNQPGASTPISKPGFGHSLATSTTPAGPPPSGSGAVGNPGSIFLSARTQVPSPNFFGAASTSQFTSQDVKSSAAPASVFSGFTAPSGPFEPKKPAELDTSKSDPFPKTNLFDKPNKPSDKDTNNLTSSGIGTSTIQQPPTNAAKSSIFFPPIGSQAPSGNTIFGGPSQTVSPGVSTPLSFPPAVNLQGGPPKMTNPSTSSVDFGLKASTESSGPSAPHTTAASGGIFPPLNPPKITTLPPVTVPTSSTIEGQQSLPAGSAKSSIFGTQTHPESSSSALPATSNASEPLANLGAGLGTSTVGPAPPAQSRLKNKSMDEIITRWASDLSTYQKEFQKQAEKVSVWDRMLVENSDKIQKLYGSTLEAERATTEVERQLTAVENDQAELQIWLEHYEREVSQMMSNQVGPGESLQGTDQERDKT